MKLDENGFCVNCGIEGHNHDRTCAFYKRNAYTFIYTGGPTAFFTHGKTYLAYYHGYSGNVVVVLADDEGAEHPWDSDRFDENFTRACNTPAPDPNAEAYSRCEDLPNPRQVIEELKVMEYERCQAEERRPKKVTPENRYRSRHHRNKL